MSGHTPGPWTVNGFGGGFEPLARLEPAGVRVSANVQPRLEEEIHNARLIAAAPDLLEALKLAHDHLAAVGTYETSPEIAQIRAALDKAEGK